MFLPLSSLVSMAWIPVNDQFIWIESIFLRFKDLAWALDCKTQKPRRELGANEFSEASAELARRTPGRLSRFFQFMNEWNCQNYSQNRSSKCQDTSPPLRHFFGASCFVVSVDSICEQVGGGGAFASEVERGKVRTRLPH